MARAGPRLGPITTKAIAQQAPVQWPQAIAHAKLRQAEQSPKETFGHKDVRQRSSKMLIFQKSNHHKEKEEKLGTRIRQGHSVSWRIKKELLFL